MESIITYPEVALSIYVVNHPKQGDVDDSLTSVVAYPSVILLACLPPIQSSSCYSSRATE